MADAIPVAVVPRDRFSMFPRCFEALHANTDVPFRVIAVAGGADRETERYLHQLELQKGNFSVVLADHLLAQGEARRLALQQIRERYCVILENDTLVHRDWLVPLLRCMQQEKAAVVTPLIFWYRGLHAAGCMFDERWRDGRVVFRHEIIYTAIRRRPIDYPETHCVLIDRRQLNSLDAFDDVEPFDVSFGLTLRRSGLRVFLEPSSVVTYSAPPPLSVRDIPLYRHRWDPKSWAARNRLFMRKWDVTYDPSAKVASYKRQQLKLGLARWYPTSAAVAASNIGVGMVNRFLALARRRRNPHLPGLERQL
jgi:glycosyltransferase involved in cell wall biosynthesis